MSHPSQRKPAGGIVATLLLAVVFLGLAIVLVPMFPGDHGSSSSNCETNQKQLGIAILAYADDYDNRFPPGLIVDPCGTVAHNLGYGWAGQIYPYVKSTAVFRCPLDEEVQGPPDPLSYAYNRNIPRRRLRQDQMSSPEKVVLLYEVTNAHAQMDLPDEGLQPGSYALSPAGDGTILLLGDNKTPRDVQPATGDTGQRAAVFDTSHWPPPRHRGAAVYLEADGHVSQAFPEKVSSGADARQAGSPQTGTVTGSAAGTSNPHYTLTFSTR